MLQYEFSFMFVEFLFNSCKQLALLMIYVFDFMTLGRTRQNIDALAFSP